MSKKSYFHRVSEQTPTRLWINNVTVEEAHLAIEAGAVGCTQNPSYPYKMLTHPGAKDHAISLLDKILESEEDDNEAQVKLQRALVSEIAQVFLPLYKQSKGKLGYVTIQGDPFHEDTDNILRSARYNHAAGPNIMAKIPATESGIRAINALVLEGIPIAATEVMSVRQALDAGRLYRHASENMENPPVMCFAHIPGIFDQYIAGVVEKEKLDIPSDYVWQGGIAVAKKIAQVINERGFSIGFVSGGARGLQHFTEMVGCNAAVTVNWSGTADKLLEEDYPVVQRFLQPTPYAVIDALCEKIPDFRKAYEINGITPAEYEDFGPVKLFRGSFESAWTKALEIIRDRRREQAR